MTSSLRHWCGEVIGTFVLVFIGCGSVGLEVLFGTFGSLLLIAGVWAIAVILGIYASRKLSLSHLNPAVTLAMIVSKKISLLRGLNYMSGQLVGAICAGLGLFILLNPSITHYESVHSIIRGTPGSQVTAQMFGEFFPNPGFADSVSINWVQAMIAEGLGTFTLIFVIFKLTDRANVPKSAPVLIGLTVGLIICVVAPYTQAGLNPARDLGPRLVAYVSGWSEVAFPSAPGSFFTVYIIGPFIGAVLAVIIHALSRLFSVKVQRNN